MRLGILHLSDLHFREGTNIAMERVHKIGPALISADGLIDAWFVAVTGDIAFSGKKAEYNQAHQFFNSLIQLLTSKYGAHNVGVFMVPGNHDCDFSGTAEVRSILLDGLESRLENFDPQGDLACTLLGPQSEFFNFDSQWAGASEPGQPWLYRAKTITLQATVIRARCYNTAFASRLAERQGQIYFPTQIAPSEGKSDSKNVLTLSLFHHPYPWLEANNGLKFRRHIENSSQIVLTGHMHSQAIYTKNNLEGESVDYQEGAAFQNSDSLESGFNVVVCDLDLQRHRRFEFKWVDASYVPSKTEEWNPFVANKALKAAFENTEDYANDLHDAGAGFTHPRKSKLVLSDIFVPPDLGRFDFERRVEGRGALTPIQSGEVENFLLVHDRLLIVGGEQSGKTTLAKTSYVALQERGFVPLCIS